MKKVLMTASALALGATTATAGGIERSNQSVGILFEEGNYAEFSLGGFQPDVSGSVAGGLVASGDMAGDFGTYSLGYKHAITEKLDFAFVLDNALGANVNYPTGTLYPISGSTATISNTSLTAMLRYKMPQNVSVIGGLRALRTSGRVALPTVAGYAMNSTTETDYGYLVGVAWEKPEIAARVSLTYNSKIDHNFTYSESSALTGGAVLNTFETVTIPESVNLEFQTGIAKDTLLFGSVRWVHWSQFDITPSHYAVTLGQGSLVNYTENTTTYTLGLGRKFNEKWSGAAILGYEKNTGTPTGNLGPTDGFRSIALAASYQATEAVKITGAVRYVDIGNATTNPPVSGNFTGNSGWGAGLRVGISF
ncbi:hypothetical protein CKO11_10905 [Rhodobacter sp. TJ_12]|uniref:outer membrane protein transport protein n=1 Tax=Rhodobacter sp. TJ_12 TaxID=2029399 RepID=UPI001CBCDCFE|nr:outer membrane protein transport protein [Rhodobacter sp. TJ_12]MBZ4022968.1 hypothetical protein [Rhodobacter sp. TJ_12]